MHKCYENDIKKSHRIFWGWLWPLEVTYIFPTLLCAVFSHSVASNSLQSHWLYSPSGSSVHGDSPGKNNGVVSMPSSRGSYQPHSATCILFYLYHHGKMTILIFQLLSCVQLFATPWTVAHQLLCPWGFPGKNTGVGFHVLLQGIFLIQRSNPCLLHWQVDFLPLDHQGSPGKRLGIYLTTCTDM